MPVPMLTPPSRKVTVPVAVPENWGATVAVKVVDWPNTEGFTEEEMTVAVVLAWLTDCVNGAEVLAFRMPWPAYDTEIVWLPSANADVVRVAVPPARVAVP